MQRGGPLVWLSILLLAGCLDEPDPLPVEDGAPSAAEALAGTLPPRPDNVSLDALVGLEAAWPEGIERPEGTKDWIDACILHWRTGAYIYAEPPIVADRPCLMLPTEMGVLHWGLVESYDPDTYSQNAAPVVRPDGAFDWVFLDPRDHQVYYMDRDGHTQPLAVVEVANPGLETASAVWVGDELHVLFAEYGGVVGRPLNMHHLWWTPGGGPAETEVLRGAGVVEAPRLRGDGLWAAVATDDFDITFLQLTNGGPFQVYPMPGLRLFTVDIEEDELWACASRGNAYHAIHGIATEAGAWVFTVEPISAAMLADVAFFCGTAVIDGAPTMVFDSPLLFGGSSFRPFAGSVAATRGSEGWTMAPLDFEYHHAADLGAVGTTVIHLGETGNGTGSGDPQNGTELRAPVQVGDVDEPWNRFWGNFGRTTRLVEDPERLLVVGEGWFNPPFEFPDYDSLDRVTRGVVEVPLPRPQP